MPAFVSDMAFGSGPLQFLLQLAQSVFVGIEERHVLTDDLIALVAVNAFRSRIPGDHLPIRIQQEQRIVLHPAGTLPLEAFLANCVTPSAGPVLSRNTRRWRTGHTFPLAEYSTSRGSPVRPTSRSVPSCSPSSRKRCQRSEITGLKLGSAKSSRRAADDLLARESQELAGSDTGLSVPAIVVGEQDGRRRMEYDRPEQHLELSRTVFHKPTYCLWLRS